MAAGVHAKKVHLLEIYLNMGQNFDEHRRVESVQATGDPPHRPIKRKPLVLILFDTQAGFNEERGKTNQSTKLKLRYTPR